MSTTDTPTKGRGRGFASLSVEQRRIIASLGGKEAHRLKRAHVFTPEEARKAGAKGGSVSRRRKVQQP